MSAPKYRSLVVHLADGGTEAIPVKPSAVMPSLEGKQYLTVEAVDKSVVTFRADQIIRMHLKPATT